MKVTIILASNLFQNKSLVPNRIDRDDCLISSRSTTRSRALI